MGVHSTFYALESNDFTLGANEFAIRRKLFARILSGVVVRAQAKLSSKILFSLDKYSCDFREENPGVGKDKKHCFPYT